MKEEEEEEEEEEEDEGEGEKGRGEGEGEEEGEEGKIRNTSNNKSDTLSDRQSCAENLFPH